MVVQKPLVNCMGQIQEDIENANHVVTIIWGTDRGTSETFGFDTYTEKDMFLSGVNAACGWLEYEIEGDEAA